MRAPRWHVWRHRVSASTAAAIGDQQYGLGEKADGRFVVVSLSVHSDRDESATLTDNAFQLEVGGNKYDTDSDGTIAAIGSGEQPFFLEDIGPGADVNGKVVFDVPLSVIGKKIEMRFNELGVVRRTAISTSPHRSPMRRAVALVIAALAGSPHSGRDGRAGLHAICACVYGAAYLALARSARRPPLDHGPRPGGRGRPRGSARRDLTAPATLARPPMSEDIREILLDLPLVQTEDRPEGMIVLNAGALPEGRRAEADAFVAANGGLIGQKPMLEVIGGTSPEGGPPAAVFYALPPAALVPPAE